MTDPLAHETTGILHVEHMTSSGRDGRLAVIEGENMQMALVFDPTITPSGMVLAPDRPWLAAALSPDVGVLALSEDVGTGSRRFGAVNVFDVTRAPTLRKRHEVMGVARALCFLDDGRTLVVGTSAQVLLVFDAQTGAELPAFVARAGDGLLPNAHKGSVNVLARSPDGARLVSAASCRETKAELKVWDVATRAELVEQTFTVPGTPESLHVSPDGRWIALGVTDGGVHVRPLR